MDDADLHWTTPADVVEWLLRRLAHADLDAETNQRALAIVVELADARQLLEVRRRFGAAASDEVSARLALACAMRHATTTPYAALEAGEIERLFARAPEGNAALARLRRPETEGRRTKPRGAKYRHDEEVRSIDATTAEGERRLCEIARHGDKRARIRALRSLVLAGRGREAFRHVAAHSTEYLPVRLSLHGLGRSDDPSDHDLLLRAVLARPDGIAHLACLAALAGVEPISPDAYADDLAPARKSES
jgi:hypothetical protein